MYVNFPGREGMHKHGCMLGRGDLDAAQTICCRNPGYGSSRRYSPILRMLSQRNAEMELA